MHAFSALFVAALPLLASAITITQPTSGGWIGNSTVTLAWTWTVNDVPFTVELGNPDIQYGLLAQGPIAVLNNINPNVNSVNFELPVLPPGTNYFVSFVDPSDINTVYASVSHFPIISNPTSSSVSLPSSAGLSTTTRSIASATRNSTSTPSSRASSSAANTTSHSSSTVPTTTQNVTTLIISTPSSSTPSPTKKSGGALPVAAVGWNSIATAVAIFSFILGSYAVV